MCSGNCNELTDKIEQLESDIDFLIYHMYKQNNLCFNNHILERAFNKADSFTIDTYRKDINNSRIEWNKNKKLYEDNVNAD
jgi:hypothetical protein